MRVAWCVPLHQRRQWCQWVPCAARAQMKVEPDLCFPWSNWAVFTHVHPACLLFFLGIVLPNWSICIRGFSTFVHLTGPSMSYIFICWGTKFNGHHGDHTEWHLAAKGDTLRRSLGLAQTGRRLSEEKVAVFAGFLRVDVSPVSDPKRYSMGLRLVECFCLPKTELWYWYIFVL